MAHLIYDFGMHIADDTAVYLRKGFRVVAVEANPLLCEQARDRFQPEIASGDLVIINKAIGPCPGTFEFYVCEDQTTLSTASRDFVKKQARQKGSKFRTVEVEFTTANAILEQFGDARYIKIDIEGHDLICLEQIARSQVKVDYLSFEVDLGGYREALKWCRQMGFSRYKLVSQASVAAALAPSPSAEGNSIEHVYTMGQTGPFGDDLVGWSTAEEIAATCRSLYVQSKLGGLLARIGLGGIATKMFPETIAWYDIHAGQPE